MTRLYGPVPGRTVKPVVLVEDNGPVHVSKITPAWLRGCALSRQQNNPRPLPQTVLGLARARQTFKLSALCLRQNDRVASSMRFIATLNHDSRNSDSGY